MPSNVPPDAEPTDQQWQDLRQWVCQEVQRLRRGTGYGDVEIRLCVRDGRIAFVEQHAHQTTKWRGAGSLRYDPLGGG